MDKTEPNPSEQSTNNRCQDVLALIPAYSIGATDPDETEFVMRNLADCPDAVTELGNYAQMAEALHYAAPPVEAPAYLAQRLAAQLQQPATVKIAKANRKRQPILRPAFALVAAAVIALVVVNLYAVGQLTQMRSRQDLLEAHIGDQNRALMLLGLGTATRIELTPNQAPDTPYAAIVWNPKSEYILLYVKDFPALPADQVYELWLLHNGQFSSAGTFQIDVDGIGTLFYKTSMPIINADSIIITHESAIGNTQPTLPPVVVYKHG